MQNLLRILTLVLVLAAATTAARADVPVSDSKNPAWAADKTTPLANRYLPQRISRTGWTTLSQVRNANRLRTVTTSPSLPAPKK